MNKRKNQPKYHFLKNTSYALSGLKDALISEKSFQIECIIVAILWCVILFIPMQIYYKMILFISLFLPLIAELINSSIERVVDLASPNYHDLAKKAKDLGSSVVFVCIVTCTLIWMCIIYLEYFNKT